MAVPEKKLDKETNRKTDKRYFIGPHFAGPKKC